jgi:predicted HicB family RNase H-like nuclease
MAKKTAGANTVQATPTRKRRGKAVRLDIDPKDHDRLERAAKERGLTMASYARMALFERLKADEGSK